MKYASANSSAKSHSQKGFVLITAGLCSVAMLGFLGLALDLGRMYIVKSEIQAYADSAALAAALELDGTSAGVARALSVVASNPNRWNLGTATFTGTQVDFADDATGPWQASPSPATGYRFTRVRAQGAVPLYVLPAVGAGGASTVRASAIAGQVEKTNFREGLLPFSPFSHNSAPPDFGFVVGQRYTLRWPSNPKVGVNVCPGDDAEAWVAQAEAGGGSERGYIEETSSAVIRAAIEQDYQTRAITVGDAVTMSGGNKQTQRDSLLTRINQDTDPVSATYAEYEAGGLGNGRRLVAVAINNGHPDNIVLGLGLFFLLAPTEYDHSGNRPFCAEYVGPFVQGSRHKGAGGPGAYVVRLVR